MVHNFLHTSASILVFASKICRERKYSTVCTSWPYHPSNRSICIIGSLWYQARRADTLWKNFGSWCRGLITPQTNMRVIGLVTKMRNPPLHNNSIQRWFWLSSLVSLMEFLTKQFTKFSISFVGFSISNCHLFPINPYLVQSKSQSSQRAKKFPTENSQPNRLLSVACLLHIELFTTWRDRIWLICRIHLLSSYERREKEALRTRNKPQIISWLRLRQFCRKFVHGGLEMTVMLMVSSSGDILFCSRVKSPLVRFRNSCFKMCILSAWQTLEIVDMILSSRII